MIGQKDRELSHTLTGVWVEISIVLNFIKAPKSHPHGCVSWNIDGALLYPDIAVTPSRVCELKLWRLAYSKIFYSSHPHGCVSWNSLRRAVRQILFVTPSRVCELKYVNCLTPFPRCVTPSRVCELKWKRPQCGQCKCVTPSRVCELKSKASMMRSTPKQSHPHGCVSWNCPMKRSISWKCSHTLTGVWVEIGLITKAQNDGKSHPHGCVSWNSNIFSNIFITAKSHPHGCVSWNPLLP